MNSKLLIPLLFVCFLFAGLWIAYGQGTGNRPAAVKWEYKTIVIVRAARSNADWSDWAEGTGSDTRTLPLPISVPKRANELGEQGWELFSMTSVSNNASANQGDLAGFTSQIVYWFKRPKQ